MHAYVRPMINRISIAKSIHDSTLEMNMRMKWTHMSVKKSKDDYIRSGVRYAFLKKMRLYPNSSFVPAMHGT